MLKVVRRLFEAQRNHEQAPVMYVVNAAFRVPSVTELVQIDHRGWAGDQWHGEPSVWP